MDYLKIYKGNVMKKENVKKNNETDKLFLIISLFAFVVTFILSIMNSKFIPSCMLMLSLLLFSICYRIKDNNKKVYLYILYVVAVLLIVGSLLSTFMRIY